MSNSTFCKLNFFFTNGGGLRLVVRDTLSGEKMKISKLRIRGNKVITKERFKPTNFKTRNQYYLISDDKLKNVIKGDTSAVIYFWREDYLFNND